MMLNGAAVKQQAALSGPVRALDAVPYLFPVLGLAVTSPGWHRHLQQIAPMTAGLEIQASAGLNALPISPWAGLGVLAAWAAAALLAGDLLLRFRDA
jgi:ABC-2 type transport system permease protein